jgi:hypothetical protein
MKSLFNAYISKAGCLQTQNRWEFFMPEAHAVYEIRAGNGKHQVLLRLWDTGGGWTGSLTGGETPHVGGVVLAVPRSSLTGRGRSCDLWAVPVPGHLDNDVAVPLAKRLCVETGLPVSLTSGIHVDAATAEDIALLSANCEEAGRSFFASLEPGGGHAR